MYGSTVLVHTCFAQTLGHTQPEKCGCEQIISYGEAKYLVRIGKADWLIVYKNHAKAGFPTSRAIVMDTCQTKNDCHVALCKRYGVIGHADPKALASHERVQTIEQTHIKRFIEMLSVSDAELAKMLPAKQALIKEQRERMAVWEELRDEFIYSLSVPFAPDPCEGKALVTFWNDDRTNGRNANIKKSWDDILVEEQNEQNERAVMP